MGTGRKQTLDIMFRTRVCVCWGGGGGGGGVGALYPAHRRRNQGTEGAVAPKYLPGKPIKFSITLMNTQFLEQICTMCATAALYPALHPASVVTCPTITTTHGLHTTHTQLQPHNIRCGLVSWRKWLYR